MRIVFGMGILARELAQASPELLETLERAYADEWFAHYNYFFAAHVVHGRAAPPIAGLLRRKSGVALDRAERLAQRLLQLGTTPPPKLGQLTDAATDKPFKLPEDLEDMTGVLKAVLDADRTSIRTFNTLLELSRSHDPLTNNLALGLLTDAVASEQEMESLLGASSPEMTGT